MPLQLAVPQPDGVIAEHTLFAGRDYVVGRAQGSDIVIANAQVSRQHASLRADDDDTWLCTDTSSTGCYDNGQPVASTTIASARVLHFGPVPCRLTPVSRKALVKQDSQQVWRKQQLGRYHRQINRCESTLTLVNVARECMQQTLHCERAALILFDKQAGFQSSIGYQPWMDADSFSGSRTIISRCMEAGTPLAIGNIQQDTSLNAQQSILQHGIKAALCVPVKVENDTVGVLYGDNTQGRVYFSDTDVRFATSLGQFLSLRLLFQSIEHKISLAACS